MCLFIYFSIPYFSLDIFFIYLPNVIPFLVSPLKTSPPSPVPYFYFMREYLCTVHQVSLGPKEVSEGGIWAPGTGVVDGCETSCSFGN